ncbi:cell differentiation protein rcd1-like isoform X1 [Diospyros lotus]|uniref:cell differentiation protein rcd1-like isoform X1 n=1 Tax=Diospyros lotus TaxID=55363 RepID=UPI0022568746|nr:cell differentiation protein rcd1-like isoform X1 [Diospyros lotus]
MPFRYLGIPLVAVKLRVRHYESLISKISDNIKAWQAASLSYAGRLELIHAMIQGVVCFWCSILPVPAAVIDQIYSLCRCFLWNSKASLVSWKDVCLPKCEGGLGLKDLKSWNSGLLIKILWDIHRKDTLWVQWIHHEFLHSISIWQRQARNDDSLLMKRMMLIRDSMCEVRGSAEVAMSLLESWANGPRFDVQVAYEFFLPKGQVKEIISIYPALSPPNLSPAQSNRVCNALALLQSVASHRETRMSFLNAQMPLYLYPLINTTWKSKPFEYLRLTSLGVIGALVKVGDTQVISFLLSTEIIPLCLKTMETGSELSKSVATFIVQQILMDDVGLDYVCTTAERFFAVRQMLGNMVAALAQQPSSRLLKYIIRCYLRLCDNQRACDALRGCLPDMLRDGTFSAALQEDATTGRCLQQLLLKVHGPRVAPQAGGGSNLMRGN